MEAVNSSMAKGVAWTLAFKFFVRGIGLISTVILARLLMPADFGLVAMAMTIIAALDLLSSFNVDTVLIQHPNPDRRHYDTAWTFNFVAGASQALLLVVLAPWIARFYDEPRLVMIVDLLAFCRLVGGAENIGLVAFRKELQFNNDFKFQVGKKLLSFAVTMVLAFWLRNYWALIGGTITGALAGVVLSYRMQSYRPRLSFAATRELFHFSKWLLINNGLYFAIHESSSFILGKIGGATSLGLFTVSYEISNLPSTDLVAPVNRAIFPGYAKMASDLNVLRQGFVNVLSAIAILIIPVGIGIVLLAAPLVHLMLGERWIAAIPLIQVLSVAGMISALGTNQGSVYLALGRARLMTMLAALHAALLLPLLLVGTYLNGPMGASQATLLVGLITMPINLIVLLRTIDLRAARVGAILWRPMVATVVMTVAVEAVLRALPTATVLVDYIVQLVAGSLIGGLVYCAVVYALWKRSGAPPGVERLLVDRIASQFGRGTPVGGNL